jgi:hypothetical protein
MENRKENSEGYEEKNDLLNIDYSTKIKRLREESDNF